MMHTRRRAMAVFALSAASVAAAAVWRPSAHLADSRPKVELEKLFPRSFGGWQVDDRGPVLLVSPETQALLNRLYNQTLSRTYVNAKGDRIMLSVAYGGDQSDATRAHRPEVCYPAQGFQILQRIDGPIDLGGQGLRTRRLVAQQGGRVEPITYWIMVGDKPTITGTEQKLAQLAYSTRGVIPDGMLVRVSNIDRDSAAGYAVQQAFLNDLLASASPEARFRIFGR